jgi:hypothetical protein
MISGFGIVLGKVNVRQPEMPAMVKLCEWKFAGFELHTECPIFR